MARDVVVQTLFDQLPVGINNGRAVAGGDMTGKHVPEGRTLPGTGAAKHSKMAAEYSRHDAHWPPMMEGIFATADGYRIELHSLSILEGECR